MSILFALANSLKDLLDAAEKEERAFLLENLEWEEMVGRERYEEMGEMEKLLTILFLRRILLMVLEGAGGVYGDSSVFKPASEVPRISLSGGYGVRGGAGGTYCPVDPVKAETLSSGNNCKFGGSGGLFDLPVNTKGQVSQKPGFDIGGGNNGGDGGKTNFISGGQNKNSKVLEIEQVAREV